MEKYLQERAELFKDKCHESYAIGGFLTTDLGEGFALDIGLIQAFTTETDTHLIEMMRLLVEDKISFWKKHSSGNYADGAVDALKGVLSQLPNQKQS